MYFFNYNYRIMKKKKFQGSVKFDILYAGGEISENLIPGKKIEAVAYNGYAVWAEDVPEWFTSEEAAEKVKNFSIGGQVCNLGPDGFWTSIKFVSDELKQFMLGIRVAPIRGAVWTEKLRDGDVNKRVFVYPDTGEFGAQNRETNFIRPVVRVADCSLKRI